MLRHTRLSVYSLALTSTLWLCVLPLLLRKFSLPELLQRTTARGNQLNSENPSELDRTVRTLVRLCHLRFFQLSLFPRDCLRQSLVLYRALTRMGYPAAIHFGVRKESSVLEGHSWVTVHNKPLAERAPVTSFTTVYSYPNEEWTKIS